MRSALLLSIFLVLGNVAPAAEQQLTENGDFYRQEMQSLRAVIQTHFFDKESGYYLNVVDPAKREKKGDYLREYTYIWALCAMYQAANEIEKLDPTISMMEPMLAMMQDYYDPAPPAAGYSDYIMKLKPGERYYDDNQWIGIASLDAYKRKRKQVDFDQGKMVYDFMMTGYDDVLGGGIYWKDTDKSTKNTCSNGPGVIVALQMHQATMDQSYLDSALKIYHWTNEHLQSSSKLFYDNIRTKDRRINKTTFSYNTGSMLQANVYLYEITSEPKYLAEANAIAESSLPHFYGRGRFRDDYWFNAVMLRAYQHLLQHNKDMKYILGFKQCLDRALRRAKNEEGLFERRNGVRNLVEHGGMLEILARFAWLEDHYPLSSDAANSVE